MPIYNYQDEGGNVVEKFLSIAEAKDIIYIDNVKYTKMISCPNIVGRSWGKISKELTAKNKEAGDRGRSYWSKKLN